MIAGNALAWTLGAVDVPPIGQPVYVGALVGGVVIGLIVLAAGMRLREGPSAAWSESTGAQAKWRGAVLSVGIGALAWMCYAVIFGATHWPPGSSEHRAGWTLAALGLAGAAMSAVGVGSKADTQSLGARTRLASWIWLLGLSAVLGAGAGLWALWPQVREQETLVRGLIGAACACGATVAMAMPLGGADRRGGGVSVAIILAGVAIASGGALLASGSIALGQIALGLGVTLLGVMIGAAIKRTWSVGGVMICVSSAGVSGLLLAGSVWSYTPWYSGVILAGAPLGGWAAENVLVRSKSSRVRAVVRVVVSAIIAGIGVATAVSLTGRAGGGGEYDY